MIKAIDKQTIHRICSGQVITTMSSAIKELIENSLDAKSTRVEIVFRDDGMETIQISDNGTGIDPINYPSIVKKHHTSKIRSFEDLSYVKSFGFRGEALSSLCAVANLSIVTRTKEQSLATVLKFDNDNNLIEQTDGAIARDVGTTVVIQNIFKNYPVRKTELKKNLKREYTKCIEIIETYGLISTGLRLAVYNQPLNQRNKKLVLQVNGTSIRDNISCILGISLFKKMQEINVNRNNYTLHGYISKVDHGSGRSSSDRQYLFLNGRPIDYDKIAKAINSIYKQYNMNQYPIYVINLCMQTESYDVNVTPDKRKVFLENETLVVEFIMDVIGKFYSPESRTLSKNTTLYKIPVIHTTPIEPESIIQSSKENTNLVNKNSKKRKLDYSSDSSSEEEIEYKKPSKIRKLIIRSPAKKPIISMQDITQESKHSHAQHCHCSHHSDEEVQHNKKIVTTEEKSIENNNIQIILDSDIEKSSVEEEPLFINISTDEVIKRFKSITGSSSSQNSTTNTFSVNMNEGNKACEAELSKKLSKSDFANMRVIGQFNKGFIITELDRNLFIIDQHASDEKYNYEDLLANTKMNTQPLIMYVLLSITSIQY
jgi:DNA mismatch repair protein PMS2